jgi:hypothetical protein
MTFYDKPFYKILRRYPWYFEWKHFQDWQWTRLDIVYVGKGTHQ